MEQRLRPGRVAVPTSTIEISISCKNLLDQDFFSRSDPICVVYTQPWTIGQWEEYMRTEVVSDNLNPEFSTKVNIGYWFEEEQPIRFMVYDKDETSNNLDDHEFLGLAECTVGRIVATGDAGLKLQLSKNMDLKNSAGTTGTNIYGSIILVAEELAELKEEISFQFSGRSMGSRFLGCCYARVRYTISRVNEAGNNILLWTSEFAPGPDPDWSIVTLNISSVCQGDKERILRLEFFLEAIVDISIGCVYASVNRLLACTVDGTEYFPVSGEDGNQTCSRLTVVQCKLAPVHTFLDYIRGGTQIHCCFAIDMTGSNGDPNDPGSLHYRNAAHLNTSGNPYEQAISAVGEIIQDYDNTKFFPAYGFGARIPPSDNISHEFNLNLQNPSPLCYGIPGVLESYRSCKQRRQS
ncbi:unnamed protein product [Allacma fusca]|uniref:C2 domain-containing protein n=1 Tax=Allacma fusca TaxID=39272 RepID=A0A8J2JQD9_9HEXA|nr:unnamed protein product [Allacma fusca]